MNETDGIANQVPVKCEICGRQDDTVRFVTYPYVISFAVITFDRVFSGCWCQLHRIQKWLAASLLTSIFGWLGIPFGIVLTPLRLLQLARGGLLDNNVNGQVLRTIGEQKLHNGDTQGAIRCFEASMLYIDDPWVNEQLRNLYRSQASDNESPAPGLMSMFVFPSMAIVFVLIGMFVGVLDFIVRWLSSFLPPELSIFVLILLQVPFVVLVYFCVSLLSYVFQSVIRLTRVSSVFFLSVAGLVISLLFINGIVTGGTYGLYISYFVNGFQELPGEIFTTLIVILTRGGSYIFSPASFASNFSGNALFAILLFLSFVLCVLVLMPKVKLFSVQQRRIAQLRSLETLPVRAFSIFGWVGLIGLVLVFILIFASVPQKSSIDTLEAFDHIVFASNHMNLGEYDRAMIEYRSAIELKPNFPLGYSGLGYAYYFSGDFGKAKENFEHALSLKPDFVESLSGLGWVYMQEGEYDHAGRKFSDALNIDPQNIDSHLGLGWVYLNQSDSENSRKEFEFVKSTAPELAEAYYGLGTLELSNYDFENAVLLLDESLRLNPNNIFAYLFKGYAYYRQGEYSAAESAFQSALKIQPYFYEALIGLGDIQVTRYEFEMGMDYYDTAIAADPKRVDAYLDKAYVLAQMGNCDEAIELVEPFADIDTDGRIKPTMAFLYYMKGFPLIGDRLLEQSIAYVDSLDGYEKGQGYMSIAIVKFSLADFTEVIKYSELAAKNYPFGLDADSHFFMARSYSALGNFGNAMTALKSGSDIGHSKVSLHYTRAGLLIDQEKLDEAEQELLSAIKMDDRSSNVYAALAFIHYQQGDLPRAVVDVKKALQLNPYNSYAHTQLAYVYQAQGRIDEALVEAQEAVRLNILDDTAHYILGVCYMESGQSEDAIREFERFLDLYWDRAYVREYKVKAEEYLEQLRQSP